ncbi:MAG: nicotinamide riboside transporter PnuC [Povalibacter sp.]
MSELLTQLRQTSPWEAIAAALGLAYLLLAVRRNLLCWICAFVSTAIYLVIFARASLYMQSALQVFYLVMAVVGFLDWRKGRDESGEVLIRHWRGSQHLAAFGAVMLATAINGWSLAHTDAASPYVDSFVTWASVVTTWMVARRVIENWLYWIVVDAIAAWLYYSQGLLVTTVLFVIYLGIVVHGYFAWRTEQRAQAAAPADTAHVAG